MINDVQGKILAMIARSDGMKYSEAYPGEGIDDDLYNYHLQELVKRKLLEKTEKIYRLTDKGKKEMVYINSAGEQMDILKVVVLLVVTRNNKSEILVRKRNQHPHRGEISTLSARVRLGEKFVEAAKRRLFERAGLLADFKHWGDYRVVRKTVDEKVFEDMIFCVCVTENPSGVLIDNNEYGDNWWDKFDKIYDYLNQNTTTSKTMISMLKKIQKGEENGERIEEEEETLNKY